MHYLLSYLLLILLGFSHLSWKEIQTQPQQGLLLCGLLMGQTLIWNVLYWKRQYLHSIPVLLVLISSIYLARSTPPLLEDDFYRYYFDGRQSLAQGSPYLHAPVEIKTGLPPDLKELKDKINFPHLVTLYPPGAELLFAVLALLSFGKIEVFNWLLALGGGLFFAWSFYLLQSGRKQSKRSQSIKMWKYAFLFLLHPLLLREWFQALHYDSWLVGLMLFSLVFSLSRDSRGFWLSLGAAFQFKWTALPLILQAPQWKTRDVLAFILIVTIPSLWLLSGWSGFAFTWQQFSHYWEMNSGPYRWVLSLIQANSNNPDLARWIARIICLLLFLGSLGYLNFAKKCQKILPAERYFWTLFLIVWLSPLNNAWYFTWSLPFLHFVPEARRKYLLWIFAWVPMTYLYSTGSFLGLSYQRLWDLEHLLIIVLLCLAIGPSLRFSSKMRTRRNLQEPSLDLSLLASEGKRLGVEVPVPRLRHKAKGKNKNNRNNDN